MSGKHILLWRMFVRIRIRKGWDWCPNPSPCEYEYEQTSSKGGKRCQNIFLQLVPFGQTVFGKNDPHPTKNMESRHTHTYHPATKHCTHETWCHVKVYDHKDFKPKTRYT